MTYSYHTEVEEKVVAAVSSLKRANGIPDSPKFKDTMNEKHTSDVDVFTSDLDSAQILGNVLSQCVLVAMGKTNEKKFTKEEERHCYRMAEITPLEGGNFRVRIDCPVKFRLKFADRVLERVQALIAPDKPRRSR